MTAAVVSAAVAGLDRLDPLERFEALIGGANFAAYLREEPITFEMRDPTFGYGCAIEGCAQHSTQASGWCTGHAGERLAAMRDGSGEADWKRVAVPLASKASDRIVRIRRPACRLCPDRDAVGGGLCRRHTTRRHAARRRATGGFDEAAWSAGQGALPGAGDCRVPACVARAESEPGLCSTHRKPWVGAHSPVGEAMQRWLSRAGRDTNAGVVSLAGLAPLVAAEIRYGLWAHTRSRAAARWHPMWLRTLVSSCRAAGATSLLDLDPADRAWTTSPTAVNRIVAGMRDDVEAVHYSRADTRHRGYLDPAYWGVRSPSDDRCST